MGALRDMLKGGSTSVWNWFFPRKLVPPECVLELLRFVYPGVDWSHVTFYAGCPHLIRLFPCAAITLPATYTPYRIHIYFRSGWWNPCTAKGLALVVHEGFHVLQIRDVLGGWGLGFARPFIAQYLACWATNGFQYDHHPMEEAAYRIAGRTSSLYESCCGASPLVCDCSTDPPAVNETVLVALQRNCGHLVQESSRSNFWKGCGEYTPGLVTMHRAAQWHFRRRYGSEVAAGQGSLDPDAPDSPASPGTSQPEPLVPGGLRTQLRRVTCCVGFVGGGLLYGVVAVYFLVWMLLWCIVALALWVAMILVESLGVIVAGSMWAITGMVCMSAWTWNRLKDLGRAFQGLFRIT